MNNEPVRKERDHNFDMPNLSPERMNGNIWGWRNSAIGAIIIFIAFMIATIRYCQVKPEKMYIRESLMEDSSPQKIQVGMTTDYENWMSEVKKLF